MRWLLLAALAVCVTSEFESLARRVFLKTPASYAKLTSEQWKIGESTEDLVIALRFKSQTAVGRILGMKILRQDGGLETTLTVGLSDGYLQIDLYNKENQKILNKPLTATYMNSSWEHSLMVRINPLNKLLTYAMETRSEYSAEITEDIQWAGAEVMATLGAAENAPSVIGCVTLVAIHSGVISPSVRVMTIDEVETELCSTNDECSNANCGTGTCLPLEVATCDCYGTGKSGPNCNNEARTVSLNNAVEDADAQANWFKYLSWTKTPIRRIAMQFKFADSSEGVLVYGKLQDDVALKMYVVDSLGSLNIGEESRLNFTLVPDVEFHSVEILFPADGSLSLTVDGATQKSPLPYSPVFESVLFGSSLPSDGVSEVGLTGCLRETFVDHHDVIQMLHDRDSRVSSSSPLRACTSGDEIITMSGSAMFPADEVPKPLLPIVSDDESATEGEMPDSDDEDEQNTDQADQSEAEKIGTAGMFPSPAKKKLLSAQPCEKSQDYVCRNGASCQRDGDTVVCVCPNGYGGTYCQFVLLPHSCSESSVFRRAVDGPTRVDPDGTENLSASVADCQDGITTVPHDMPPATPARDSMPFHSLFLLSYRDFSPQKMAALIGTSAVCTQSVNYICNKAPLGFSSNRTWFSVATGNRTVTQLGVVPESCQCLDLGCMGHNKCNCDADGISSDEGVLKNELAGITSIVALHKEGAVSGQFTVGPLECKGFAGDSAPIRFSSKKALRIDDVTSDSFSLQFRTSDAKGTILTIEKTEEDITVQLVDGHTVRLTQGDVSVTVDSQAKLNDTAWHMLVVEFNSGEVRLSVDGSHAFGRIASTPGKALVINDEQNGFVGCVRSLMIGNKLIDLHEIVSNDKQLIETVFLSCLSRCSSSVCRNNGECLEDFATDTAVCRCRYPNIQSGRNCENDINVDSSVSFHGGYLMFEKTSSSLLEAMVMSFRTDQANALLLFAHDHNNNFIQLHLKDEVNLTLSLNNGDVIESCTVMARPGSEYGDMRWIQISITHSDSGSQLEVEEDACSIRSTRKLSDDVVRVYSNWNPDLVTIPVGQGGSTSDRKPFIYTFVGGVERQYNTKGGPKRLHPEYTSSLPDLLGCLRGFRIADDVIDLRHTTHGYRPEDPTLVRTGCDVKCDTLFCMNGGHCSVGWQNYDPSASHTSCDCSRTSYAGPSCTTDSGLSLSPGQSFSFDVGSIRGRYIEPVRPPSQTLKFAFSTSTTNQRQMLAIVYFRDESEFEVLLNKNGSLNVGITDPEGRSIVQTFKGNFSDGFRHLFVAEFSKDSATAVMVDSRRQDFSYRSPSNLDLFDSTLLMIGSQLKAPNPYDMAAVKRNYVGCISNIQLDFSLSPLDLWPLTYLFDRSLPYSNYSSISPSGDIIKGGCAPFRVPNTPPVLQNTVSLPVWETNFARLEYKYDDVSKEEGSSLWWLWLLLVLLIILLVVFCVFIFCCRRKNNTNNAQGSHDERRPLQTTYPAPPNMNNSPIGGKPSSNYHVPQPDIELTTTSQLARPAMSQKNGSWQSGLTSYFTAQEELTGSCYSSDGSLDKTLTQTEGEGIDAMDILSRPSGFDRSSPQRMSSFRSDTVPRDSPLYSSDTPRRPRPVAPPVPPPRASPENTN